MKRRGVIKFLLLALGGVFLKGAVFERFTQKRLYTKQVTIYFPNGKSYEVFMQELDQWVDLDKWFANLRFSQKTGLLVDYAKKVYRDRIVLEFRFEDPHQHQAFLQQLHNTKAISFDTRDKLGYFGATVDKIVA